MREVETIQFVRAPVDPVLGFHLGPAFLVVGVDSSSCNETFISTIDSDRLQEVVLKSGDTVIFSEADAARFVYQK